jgi:hypothetical protein
MEKRQPPPEDSGAGQVSIKDAALKESKQHRYPKFPDPGNALMQPCPQKASVSKSRPGG